MRAIVDSAFNNDTRSAPPPPAARQHLSKPLTAWASWYTECIESDHGEQQVFDGTLTVSKFLATKLDPHWSETPSAWAQFRDIVKKIMEDVSEPQQNGTVAAASLNGNSKDMRGNTLPTNENESRQDDIELQSSFRS